MGERTVGQNERVIRAEWGGLAPLVDKVNGREARDEMRAVFESAADAYARGRYNDAEFRGIVGELIRDASGMIAQQDRSADAYPALVTVPAGRGPWAVMPRDGDAVARAASRVLLWVVMACATLAALWVVVLTVRMVTDAGDDVPADTPGVSLVGASLTGAEGAAGGVVVDVGTLPSPDCWYAVGTVDGDGFPGGRKVTRVTVHCP